MKLTRAQLNAARSIIMSEMGRKGGAALTGEKKRLAGRKGGLARAAKAAKTLAGTGVKNNCENMLTANKPSA